MPRALRYGLAGLVLALGAPLGWLLLHLEVVSPASAVQVVAREPGLYAYLLVGTALAFTAFGAVLGRMADQLELRQRELELLSATDALTGLANRREFERRMHLARAEAARSGAVLAVIMVDLDHFKRINDRRGHALGDRALAHVARVLRSAVRDIDLVARVGGEEFALLCPGADEAAAAEIAERARTLVASTPLAEPGELVVLTASFGVAAGPAAEVPGLLTAADAALYRAKSLGRNQVALASGAPPAQEALRS